MRKIIPFILAVLVLIVVSNNYNENYYIIPDESIRIRIIPNSNAIKDQYIKIKIKNNLKKELEKDLIDTKDINTSRTIIKSNINKYENKVKEVLTKEKTNERYTIDYGYHYFPEKTYKGVKYKEGRYESLLVTIGNAQGDNWWCVLFPPICKIEENSKNLEKIEYTFYIKEMFNKYLK